MCEAISYPIFTYGCESWKTSEVESELQIEVFTKNKRDYETRQSKERSGETRTESWINIGEST